MLTEDCQSHKLWLSTRAAVKLGLRYDYLKSQHVRYAPAAFFLLCREVEQYPKPLFL